MMGIDISRGVLTFANVFTDSIFSQRLSVLGREDCGIQPAETMVGCIVGPKCVT
jgi:hypothetical protein